MCSSRVHGSLPYWAYLLCAINNVCFQGLLVGLEGGDGMRKLMEIAKGRAYDNEYQRFHHPLDQDIGEAVSTRILEKNEKKEEIVKNAMERASKGGMNHGARAKRIALGRAAISRRVRGVNGEKLRSLGFGRKRMKNTTASLVGAEKMSQKEAVEI